MPGTFFGFEIARRGVNVHRAALDITGHNIANANTPGYSRQAAVIEASQPWTLPDLATKMQPGQLGTGVQADSVRRIRDNYLDAHYRQSSSLEGYWQKKLDNAQQMEAVFPEPDGQGIQAAMLDFFNNWQNLNNNPQDPGVKTAVRESGDLLASSLRQTYSQLENIGKGFSGAINDQVTQVNQILTNIAGLSNTIIISSRTGTQPNDLLDKRDNLLDQLARIARINVVAQDNMTIKVTFMDSDVTVLDDDGNGKVVASQVTYSEDCLSVDGADINLTDLANYASDGPAGAGQGNILGIESARLENKNLLQQLDNLARALITNVNDRSGVTFFTGSDANDIALGNDAVIGENALAVAQLQSTPLAIDPDSDTMVMLGNYYQGIVAQVGANVRNAGNMLESQLAISQQIEALRQSTSGVSLDEELTLAMQYQYGYQASARMLNMQDELLDYLINRMR